MTTKFKKTALVLSLVGLGFVFNNAKAQSSTDSKKIEFSIGPSFHSNSLNEDAYYDFKIPNKVLTPENEILNGVNLKVSLPTKRDYLDLIVGTIYEWGASSIGTYSSNTSNDYKINGGGVYAGISPKLNGEHFGLTSEFAIGVFSYKETIVAYNDNSSESSVDIYDRRNSQGLGALSSIGFYVKFGKLGINPNLNAIFSGGNNASFTFYGFTVPLTYTL
ncbi:hypothetical protein IFO69_08520 [Echinicola sp. CAU 1574]|uniref:Uncharacterized protein n=1 Tax=Echinicola arenosa TaxID=2774144 RepID=A0ABR9AJ07_9BACT|nr:hypothetical protein [Echinicola arenosa]MBD8488786.1 hypothetical protein [Echinicola arenosa]